jgi:hypothetical protein
MRGAKECANVVHMGRLLDLKKQVLKQLAVEFGAKGYKARRTSQDFYKDAPEGRKYLHVQFIYHHQDFDIVASAGLVHQALSKLVEEVNKSLVEPEQILHIAAVGAELGNITGVGQMRWTVAEGSDIAKVCPRIVEAFETIGLPYLERFSTLEEILACAAREDMGELCAPFPATRAKMAIAAAYLLGKKELFTHLVDQKAEYVKERHAQQLPSFMAFAEALGKLWPADEAAANQPHPA